MPPNDLVEAALKGGDLQLADITNSEVHVVSRAAALELVNEPQALLRKGKRQVDVASDRRDSRGQQLLVGAAHRLDDTRQFGDGRRFEEIAQGQFDLEGVAHPRD